MDGGGPITQRDARLVDDPAGGATASAASRSRSDSGSRQTYDSPALFRGHREVVIVHRGQEYRLRITKADKLILTK